jgi:small subunit ribosomal protein S14
MAKLGAIERNNRLKREVRQSHNKRRALKDIIANKETPIEERITAVMKLAELSRNGSATRVRNRCHLSGRPRGFHRKFGVSRIALRELGSSGLIPGIMKSSW